MPHRAILVNRAPVLTLWAAVVAERLGFDRDAALTFGRAVSGLKAQSKGRTLGIFKPVKGPDGEEPKRTGLGEEFWVELCGRGVPVKNTEHGVRAVVKATPIDPGAVQRYLESKLGKDLEPVREAMNELAAAVREGRPCRTGVRALRDVPSEHPRRQDWLGGEGQP